MKTKPEIGNGKRSPEKQPRTPGGAHRGVYYAAGVAVLVLAAAGVGYRVAAAHLARLGGVTPLPPGTLAKIPLEFEGWSGKDIPMEQAIMEIADADQFLNRTYVPKGAGMPVGFYVAYGVRARDLLPHRPEVCYPGNGYTMQENERQELTSPKGRTFPCTVYRFSRAGGMGTQQVLVLNYYIVDGAFAADAELLRSKAWRGQGGAKYMAQVQVTARCSGEADMERSKRAAVTFAEQSVESLYDVLPDGSDL